MIERKHGVLVHLRFCNKNKQTNKQTHPTDWVAYRHLFLTVLEAGKSKIIAPADSVSAQWLMNGTFLLCPHMTSFTVILIP